MRGIAGILHKGHGLQAVENGENSMGKPGIFVNPADWDFGMFNLS